MKKILIIGSKYSWPLYYNGVVVGGAEKVVLDQIRYLQNEYDLYVFTHAQNNLETLFKINHKTLEHYDEEFKIENFKNLDENYKQYLKIPVKKRDLKKYYLYELENYIKLIKPDLIINHDFDFSVLNLLTTFDIPNCLYNHDNPSFGLMSIQNLKKRLTYSKQGGVNVGVSNFQKTLWFQFSKQNFIDVVFNQGVFNFNNFSENFNFENKIITIGRADKNKNIFCLQKFCSKDIDYIIYTNYNDSDYFKSNYTEEIKTKVYLNKDYKQIMLDLKSYLAFFVTCKEETYSLAGLESLCSGVPLILMYHKYGSPITDFARKEDFFVLEKGEKNLKRIYETLIKSESIEIRRNRLNYYKQNFNEQNYKIRFKQLIEEIQSVWENKKKNSISKSFFD